MRAGIRDSEALLAISPAALSAYARAEGWARNGAYGDHADVYAAEELPEITLPRTRRLGDYAHVVSRLIDIFAQVADMDEISIYRDLVTADRDVIRVRAAESNDGAVAVDDGLSLMQGASDMLLAAACSLRNPQPLYRAGANKEASDFMRRVRLGQTEHGSFVITLLTPVIPPPLQPSFDPDWTPDEDSGERLVTRRLADALETVRHATERTVGGDIDAFYEAVEHGVSANLCESLVTLIEPFPTLDIGLTWARTRPMPSARSLVRFANDDAPIIREAARSFRDREPQPDVRLFGFVQQLRRDEEETDGTITLRASVDGQQTRSVTTVLSQSHYQRAIQAHSLKAPVVAEGDLERAGQRWHLRNPRITSIISAEDSPAEVG
jgi:hypothetical protein